MEKLYIDKWFKLPPKEEKEKLYTVSFSKKGDGKKYAKLHKKVKKQTKKKSG